MGGCVEFKVKIDQRSEERKDKRKYEKMAKQMRVNNLTESR